MPRLGILESLREEAREAKKAIEAQVRGVQELAGGAFQAATGLFSPIRTKEAREKGLGIRSPIVVGPTPETDRSRSLALVPTPGGVRLVTGENPLALASPLLLREPITTADKTSARVATPQQMQTVLRPVRDPGVLAEVVGGVVTPGPAELAKGVGLAAAGAPFLVKAATDLMNAPLPRSLKAVFRAGEKNELRVFFDYLKTTGRPRLEALGGRGLRGIESDRWFPEDWDAFSRANDVTDRLVEGLPGGGLGELEWARQIDARLPGMEGLEVIGNPKTLSRWHDNPEQLTEWLGKSLDENPLVRDQALDGLLGVRRNHEIARMGRLSKEQVSLHYVWGALSKGVSPVDQEAGWIRLTKDLRFLEEVERSLDGSFDTSQPAWRALVSDIMGGQRAKIPKDAPPGSMSGFWATANANALWGMLKNMNGRWDGIAQVLNNRALDGPKMVETIWKKLAAELPREGGKRAAIGISDKVNRFVVATLARPDVVVIDRWRVAIDWGDNLVLGTTMGAQAKSAISALTYFDSTGMLRGAEKVYEAITGGEARPLSRATRRVTTLPARMDARTHAVYRAVESGMKSIIERGGARLADIFGYRPDVFDLHWMTWAAYKNEPVGHSSLSLLTDLARSGKLTKDFERSVQEAAFEVEAFRRVPGGGLERRAFSVTPSGESLVKTTSLPDVGTSGIRPEPLRIVEAQEFVDARAKVDPARRFFLGTESSEDITRANYQTMVAPDGKSGVALKPLSSGKELVNLFRHSDGRPGVGKSHILWAVQNGATELNNFDGGLTDLYSAFGFRPVARMKFVDEFAPPDWEKYREAAKIAGKSERPDVVFMRYEGGDRGTIQNRIGSFGFDVDIDRLPVLDEWPGEGIEAAIRSGAVRPPAEVERAGAVARRKAP